MNQVSVSTKGVSIDTLYHILRIACVMCFIGHGAFGIITKKAWVNYFGVFGVGETLAYQLMPVVGVIDILIGITLLVYPTRAAVAWLVFWGLFTAFLRPLSGEPFAEFLERAGNYGAPIVLLLITVESGLFSRMKAREMDEPSLQQILRTLQVISAVLIFSHGWLNMIGKQGLLLQYKTLGFGNPEVIAHSVGFLEMIAAIVILTIPRWEIIVVFFLWKIASESMYPQFGLLEWIERGGSYGVLLSLAILLKNKSLAGSGVLQYLFASRTGKLKLHA